MKRIVFFGFALTLLVLPLLTYATAGDGNLPTATPLSSEVQLNALRMKALELQLKLISLKVSELAEAVRVAVAKRTNDATAPAIAQNTPVVETLATWLYAVTLTGTTPKSDATRYALIDAPSDMHILPTLGTVYWTPTLDEVRSEPYAFTVAITNGNATEYVHSAVRVKAPASSQLVRLPQTPKETPVVAIAPPAPKETLPAKNEAAGTPTLLQRPLSATQPEPASPAVNITAPLTAEAAATTNSSAVPSRYIWYGIAVIAVIVGYFLFRTKREEEPAPAIMKKTETTSPIVPSNSKIETPKTSADQIVLPWNGERH